MLFNFSKSVKRRTAVLSLMFVGIAVFLPYRAAADNNEEQTKEEVKAFRRFLIPLMQEQAQIESDRGCQIEERRAAGEKRVGDLEISRNLAKSILSDLRTADEYAKQGDLDTAKIFANSALLKKGIQVVASLTGLAAELLGYTDLPVPRVAGALKVIKYVAEIKKLDKVLKAVDGAEKANDMYEQAREAKDKLDKLEKLKDELEEVKRALQGSSALDFPPTSPELPDAIRSEFAGKGSAAGEVFNATFTNTSACPVRAIIPLGTVLAPSDTRYQVMMIAELYVIHLKPGETVTVILAGYCLDPEKQPPAKPDADPKLHYTLVDPASLSESQRQDNAFSATIIQEGNELSIDGKYDTTPLPPAEAKKTVIQWTLWHVRKPDVYTQAKLEGEVTKQFKEAGMDVTTPQAKEEIQQGTAQIWAAVGLTLEEARRRSRTDIAMRVGPGETRPMPPVPVGDVRVPHAKGEVRVSDAMAKTVADVLKKLKEAGYKVFKQNVTWDDKEKEFTVAVEADGDKPAQRFVIDRQGFILRHHINGKLDSRTTVRRNEKGVPMSITSNTKREDHKTEITVTKYVEVDRQGSPQRIVTKEVRRVTEENGTKRREEKEDYSSDWWKKFRDKLNDVDLR